MIPFDELVSAPPPETLRHIASALGASVRSSVGASYVMGSYGGAHIVASGTPHLGMVEYSLVASATCPPQLKARFVVRKLAGAEHDRFLRYYELDSEDPAMALCFLDRASRTAILESGLEGSIRSGRVSAEWLDDRPWPTVAKWLDAMATVARGGERMLQRWYWLAAALAGQVAPNARGEASIVVPIRNGWARIELQPGAVTRTVLVAQRTGATTEAFRFQRSALTPTPEEQRIDLPLHYHSASTNPPATLARLAAGGAELIAEVAPESVHANDSVVVVHLASVEERPEALRVALDLLESLAMGARPRAFR